MGSFWLGDMEVIKIDSLADGQEVEEGRDCPKLEIVFREKFPGVGEAVESMSWLRS